MSDLSAMNPFSNEATRKMQKASAERREKVDLKDKENLAALKKDEEQQVFGPQGGSTELFTPKFFTPGAKSEAEGLAQIFNARKEEIRNKTAKPGISQTRYGAL